MSHLFRLWFCVPQDYKTTYAIYIFILYPAKVSDKQNFEPQVALDTGTHYYYIDIIWNNLKYHTNILT